MMRTTSTRPASLVFSTLIGAALICGAPSVARAADPITEQEAHTIGVAAYTYFYPMVTMEVTRKQLTNIAKPDGMHGPMNMFVNLATFPSTDMKAVVRPISTRCIRARGLT